MLVIHGSLLAILTVQLGFVASRVVIVKSLTLDNAAMSDKTRAGVGYSDDAGINFGDGIKNVVHLGRLPK